MKEPSTNLYPQLQQVSTYNYIILTPYKSLTTFANRATKFLHVYRWCRTHSACCYRAASAGELSHNQHRSDNDRERHARSIAALTTKQAREQERRRRRDAIIEAGDPNASLRCVYAVMSLGERRNLKFTPRARSLSRPGQRAATAAGTCQ